MNAIWVMSTEQYMVIYYLGSINIKVQDFVFDLSVILSACSLLNLQHHIGLFSKFIVLRIIIACVFINNSLTIYILAIQYSIRFLFYQLFVYQSILFILLQMLDYFQTKWCLPKNYIMKQVIAFYLFIFKVFICLFIFYLM